MSSKSLTVLPPGLLTAADYERLAPQFLDAGTLAYLNGGSGAEITLRDNLAAFARHRILPRLLRDCGGGSTALSLLGRPFHHPLLLAPVAFQQLAHPDGERATARAAAATDTGLVLSTLSSVTLEAVAAETPGEKWFQLYFQPDRAATADLVRRAEAAGYGALMVTLDTPVQPAGERATRAGFVMPASVRAANLTGYAPPPRRVLNAGGSLLFQGVMADAPGWKDLEWLLGLTRLPVVVKGVAHPDDAARMKALGVAGLVVSNHGGRALDGMPSALDLLPAIRCAVGADYPLLLDGGVRSGRDAFIALAMGANAVMIGRPQLHALAVAGALGVAHLLRLLRQELELCMALAGCATVYAIGPEALHSPQL
ncbi:isopentenyl diphosphate isomerase/L-lactate dehydrogenase-like FMN-dependent dehydrogenase [Fluviicoccus keumensis]|uniref:Isopentenyl diphosphate isomerase/L-lactate dehydrogenase-like FMN-dependent dehydrogenase n=1 Tax=Fluviicoccus keumensis TaxID=1435465 RepID=A0A4Q7YPL8_9GAMM|nr:alpha-hydroxy acid oxidase [Fluviicoccus keumensis]RZU38655.1 isopentenyl diphosphate isomerase/L-lactate dehydrogenase-like FMN-dependent dehydrogenase [Fluviicoccus keumensis]